MQIYENLHICTPLNHYMDLEPTTLSCSLLMTYFLKNLAEILTSLDSFISLSQFILK